MEAQIILIPLDEVADEILEFLAEKIVQRFQCDVVAYPHMEIPEDAHVPERDQYLSSRILSDLRSSVAANNQDKVLFVADVDLFVRDLNFIFGEAEIAGRFAIVSLTRLRQSFYGKPEEEKLLLGRMAKEAIHELGHVYGLGHCADKRCVMFFSNSLMDTDQKSSDFCARCAQALDNLRMS
jgi:archaemetzincin